jgi:hypothetical protein
MNHNPKTDFCQMRDLLLREQLISNDEQEVLRSVATALASEQYLGRTPPSSNEEALGLYNQRRKALLDVGDTRILKCRFISGDNYIPLNTVLDTPSGKSVDFVVEFRFYDSNMPCFQAIGAAAMQNKLPTDEVIQQCLDYLAYGAFCVRMGGGGCCGCLSAALLLCVCV